MTNDKSARVALLVLFVLVAAVLVYRQWHRTITPGRLSLNDSRCASLSEEWKHVYRPERLEVVEPCIAATGAITNIRTEADGDLHILVALDPAEDSLLNQENTARQHRELVAEIICARPVRQTDAVDACSGWENRLDLHHGEHVRVAGAYVLDREHGWMEIHPVATVEELP